MQQHIELTTIDNVRIIGDFIRPEQLPVGYLLLLHMMPADRSSWQPFSARAAEQGFASLAIDLRGHGESRLRGTDTLDYQTFSDVQHQQSIHDITAALDFLQHQAGVTAPIILIGASIGANLALQALADHPELPGAVLLSPGLNYKGIGTPDLLGRITNSQQLFLVASNDDPRSFEAIRTLNHLRDEHTISRQISDAGHGTTMLERQPELIDDILEWLQALISNV